jgi:Ran-binding protein 9/10
MYNIVSLGRSPAAALEKLYRQTEALVDELSKEGGPAAFVNLQTTFSS